MSQFLQFSSRLTHWTTRNLNTKLNDSFSCVYLNHFSFHNLCSRHWNIKLLCKWNDYWLLIFVEIQSLLKHINFTTSVISTHPILMSFSYENSSIEGNLIQCQQFIALYVFRPYNAIFNHNSQSLSLWNVTQ